MGTHRDFLVGEVRRQVSSSGNYHPHATTQLTSELGALAGLGLRSLAHYNEHRLPRESKYGHRIRTGAIGHGLEPYDYMTIADEAGKLPKRGEQALSPQALEYYKAEAKLVYRAGRSAVHPDALDYWRELRGEFETVRPDWYQTLPSLHTLPHIDRLTSGFVEYVGQRYPHSYRLGRSIEAFHSSQKDLHHRLIDLANDMCDAKSTLLEHVGQPVGMLAPYMYNTNQAISRIYAVPYLMAADARSPEDAALFTEVSKVAWQMTRSGGDLFSDPMGHDNVELLSEQWELGLDTTLAELQDPTFRMDHLNRLATHADPFNTLA